VRIIGIIEIIGVIGIIGVIPITHSQAIALLLPYPYAPYAPYELLPSYKLTMFMILPMPPMPLRTSYESATYLLSKRTADTIYAKNGRRLKIIGTIGIIARA
jgi:hypothetical protein